MLNLVFNLLNSQAMRLVKDDLRYNENILSKLGGWEHSSKVFDLIVYRLKKIKANRDIEMYGEQTKDQPMGSSTTKMFTKAVHGQEQ